MSAEENQSNASDGCLAYTEAFGQAAGVVAGAETFGKEIGTWATGVAETHSLHDLGRAADVGSHAGKDATQAYQHTVPVAEHTWAGACELYNTMFGGHEAATGSHGSHASAHPAHAAAHAAHPHHHSGPISHPTTSHPAASHSAASHSASGHPGGHAGSSASHGHGSSASSSTH